MSFRIKSGNSYLGYFPGQYTEYAFTTIESSSIFQRFYDSSVYRNEEGAFALYHEQLNKYVRELWYTLHPDVYISGDPGMACFYQSNVLNINRVYFYNVAFEPLNNEPTQISGQFLETDTSIDFTGILEFDGVNDYKLTKSIEFGQNGFTLFVKFKPTGTPVNGETVFTRNDINIHRVGVSNIFSVNSFINPIEFTNDQDNTCDVYIGVDYTVSKLDVRINGNASIDNTFYNQPLYDNVPIILGATRNDLNYGNYFSGQINTFKCYNSFVEYNTVAGNYEYGLWAPFDSNINTVYVMSSDNYYTRNDINSGYIIRGPGEFQISDSNWTIYCKFTATLDDTEIFSITSEDYQEFIVGSIISLRRISTTQFLFEYARQGGLEVIITRLVDVTNDIEYDFYMYNSSGSFSGNMFDTISKIYYPSGILPGTYTVSSTKKDIAVYSGVVPVYEIISASYQFTGNSKTLTETDQYLGEFVDLYLGRYLKIGSQRQNFLGTSVPTYEYFGKGNSLYYEKLTRNNYYTNIRFAVNEIFPKSLNQNYVALYGNDDKINTVYLYNESISESGTSVGSITVDKSLNVYIGGYYGSHDITIKSTYFPKQLNQNIFISKLDGWKSYGVSVANTPVSVGYRPRIVNMSSDGSNVYVCGVLSESIKVYDSANIATDIPCIPPSVVGRNGDFRVFLIKYNSSGGIEWTIYSINLSSPNPYISANKTGNVYMSCSYFSGYGSTVFRTPYGDVSAPTNRGSLAFYKITKDGRIAWIAGAYGGNGVTLSSYTDEDDNGYMTGFSQGGLNVTNSDGSSTLPSASRSDNTGYIVKYNPNGVALWYNLFTNGGWTEIHKCVSDSTHIYITGNIQGTVGLQRNDGTITPMNYTRTYWSCVVMKLDLDGNFVYRRIIDGIYDEDAEVGYDIKLDENNIYTSGQYLSTRGVYIKNGSDSNVFTIPPNSSTPGSFLVKYSKDGTPLWERHLDSSTADYISENLPVGDHVYTIGLTSPSRLANYPQTSTISTGFYNIYSKDSLLISTILTEDGTTVPNFDQNKMADKMILSGYCTLLDEVKLNHSILYINGTKVLESLSNSLATWETGASPYKIFKYELHVSNVSTQDPLFIEGISTLVPEQIKPDDLIIQRLDYTPVQAQDFPAYDASIVKYNKGAMYTANSLGTVHASNVFRNDFFNYGYGYATAYDYTYSNVRITLTANLYGESNLTLTCTDEVYIYVDNSLVISNTGSNVYTKYTEYPFRLEWCGRPDVSLSDSYIQLDGLHPVNNVLTYAKTSNGIHYTNSILGGNGAAIAQTIEFSGTSPNTISIISNTNLSCNLTRAESNLYTLKIKNTNNLPISQTYAYEPSFRSVVLSGYSTSARGDFQSNIFDSSSVYLSGYFSVPQPGTYTVSNVVTLVSGDTFLDTTEFNHNITSKYYEAGRIYTYVLSYYCPPGANTNVDVILSNVNSYRLSQQCTTSEYITRIPNFYRANTAVANYKTITF